MLLLVGCLVGCGASTHARSTTTATLPTITDEWLRCPPRSRDAVPPTSAPTEITERALDQLPLLHAAAYRRLLAVGYPALEGAELREVEIGVDYIGEPLEARHALALVVPAEDGGPPWAFNGAWRPVLALGPELDLVHACEERIRLQRRVDEYRRAMTQPRWSDERETMRGRLQTPNREAVQAVDFRLLQRSFEACPTMASILPLARSGRSDLTIRLDRFESALPSMVSFMAEMWVRSLAGQILSDFIRRRDASARHHARLLLGAFSSFTAHRGDPLSQHYPTTAAVIADLERRAAATGEPHRQSEVDDLIDLLEEVAVDQPQPGSRHCSQNDDFCTDSDGMQRSSDVLAQDTTIRALVAAGPAASYALTECVRTDRRLSRSFGWPDRDFSEVVPVARLCALALREIDPSAPRLTMTVPRADLQAADVVVLFGRDDAELDQLISASAWMFDDPDGDGPSPRNLELLRGSDDDRIARVLAGRARAAWLTSQESTERDRDFETGRDGFCSLALAALMWSEESAMWVVGDAVAAVEAGWSCDRELALALRDRRPDLVARRARRVPWDDLLDE